jgi:hypothetical protein
MGTLLRSAVLAVAVTAASAAAAVAQGPGHTSPPAAFAPSAPIEAGPVAAPEPPFHVLDLTPPDLPGGTHSACDVLTGTASPGAWFAIADYLLWRPRIDANDYALVDPQLDLTPQGRIQNVAHDTRSGLRVGLGRRLPGSGWDVGVWYTYLHSTGSDAVLVPPGGVIYPTLTRPGVTDTATRAAARARLDYHVFDLDIGRRVVLDPYCSLRVFGGVRFASLDLDLRAIYDGGVARNAEVLTRSRLDAVGPTAGAEARWAVSEGLGLFGTARGGLLYGDFDGRVRESNAGGAVLVADVTDRFTGVAPVVSIGLGGDWRWKTLVLAAGYEVTHWFNAVTRPTLTDDFADGKVLRRRGDLSLDGIFLRVGLAY